MDVDSAVLGAWRCWLFLASCSTGGNARGIAGAGQALPVHVGVENLGGTSRGLLKTTVRCHAISANKSHVVNSIKDEECPEVSQSYG